jgi:serine/threonine-protein kinase
VCLLDADVPRALLGDSLELIEEVGHGGMGSVWRARHLKLDRIVAVKFLSEALACDPDFAGRFAREARLLARLQHPGIVAVHDFASAGGQSYIVMEYFDGRPLSELIPLPPERAVAVARQVLEALQYAHERGVVHRDLKPANILLSDSGRVKVTDFGIARLVDEPAPITKAGALGTPQYMAPEALAGGAPDPRMDVFSAGAVLYEMVRGERPMGDFAPLEAPLDRVVRKALAPDPARRHASAAEMARALDGASSAGDELAADEVLWLRAVALLETVATAAVLWAFLVSVSPKVLGPGEIAPLVMLQGERLADGRTVSRARFETWPTLLALAAVALGVAAQASLRRHWRQTGLERREPSRPVRESRAVLLCGGVAVATYALRRLFGDGAAAWAIVYVPILGGLLETAVVFFAWTAVLQAQRRGRPLRREHALWAGLALALVPPVTDLARYVQNWQP